LKRLKVILPCVLVVALLAATVPVFAATQADIDESIAKGMRWLATQQEADGSWAHNVGKTGLAVLKFETHAINLDISPFDPGYEYSDEVEKGLNYLFACATVIDIGPQTHDGRVDDPDKDGDGIGVYFQTEDHHRTYETAIVLMAIVSSTEPDRVVDVAGSAVDGWTFREVARDTVDYLCFGQTDTGAGRGGWTYEEQNNAGPRSDNSITGYAVLGLAYAEAAPPYGFECHSPAFVRFELDIWVNYIQCLAAGPDFGGSGYDAPCGGSYNVNILKTGNLLFEMAFLGDTTDSPRVQDALVYLQTHWLDPNDEPGWRGDPASYQATYTAMKGLERLGVTNILGVDWYADFAQVLIAQQNADGSWPDCLWAYGDPVISTEWALLTLQKAVPPPPGIMVLLREIKREIVLIEEKLDTWVKKYLEAIHDEVLKIEGKLDDETRFTDDAELAELKAQLEEKLEQNERIMIENALTECCGPVILWIEKGELVKEIVWDTINDLEAAGYNVDKAKIYAKQGDDYLAAKKYKMAWQNYCKAYYYCLDVRPLMP
jgi:hypothetical protein